LLAKVRYRLRRHHGFARERVDGSGRVHVSKFGITAVFSDQPVHGKPSGGAGLACAGYGSAVTVTATLGLALAACAMQRIAGRGAGKESFD
jgi:tRNA A37 threonylcarbamoyladenosine dehydratase